MSTSTSLCRGPSGMGTRFEHSRAFNSSLACARSAQARKLPGACVRGKHCRLNTGAACTAAANSLASEQAGASPQREPVLARVWSACSVVVNAAKACVVLLLLSCAFAVPAFASALTASAPVSIKTRWHEISEIMANAMFTPQGQLLYSVLLGFMCVGLVAVAAGGLSFDRKPTTRNDNVSDRVVASVLAQSPESTSPWLSQTSNGRSSLTAASVGGTLGVTAAASIGSTTAKREQASSRTSSAPFDGESVSGPRSFLKDKPAVAQDAPVQQEQPKPQPKPQPQLQTQTQPQPQQETQTQPQGRTQPQTQPQPIVQRATKTVEELEPIMYTFDDPSVQPEVPSSGVVFQASTAAGVYTPPAPPAPSATGAAAGDASGASAAGAAALSASSAAFAGGAGLMEPPTVESRPSGGARRQDPGLVEPPKADSRPSGGAMRQEAGLAEPPKMVDSRPSGGARRQEPSFAEPPRVETRPSGGAMRQAPIASEGPQWKGPVDEHPLEEELIEGPPRMQTFDDVRSAPPPSRQQPRTLDAQTREFLDDAKNPAIPIIFVAALMSNAVDKMRPFSNAIASGVCGAKRSDAAIGVSSERGAGRVLSVNARGAGTPPFPVATPASKAQIDPWYLAAPMANLLTAEKRRAGPIQASTLRHKADPIAAIRDIQVPTAKHDWDPVTHISSINPPTDTSRYDPWVQIHRVQPPTVRHPADPLAHISSIEVPTQRYGADPMAHLRDIQEPTARPGADPIAHIWKIDVPTDRFAADPLTAILDMQVPTDLHKADPLAHIRNIEVPTGRHAADPLAHISSLEVPTIRHKADPVAHISGVAVPTVRHAADPLAHISNIQVPTVRHDADPLTHISSISVPMVRHEADPLTHINSISVPTVRHDSDPLTHISSISVPTVRHDADPFTHISSINAPTVRHGADPLAHLSNISAPQGSNDDPLRALFRIDRPVENPAWDPVSQIGGVMPPDARPMWDPMTAIPDMKRSTSKPFWDPLSFISKLQPTGSPSIFAKLRPPTGKAWFDPLARLSAIQAPEGTNADRPGLDMFKGIVQAALKYKSKPAQQQQRQSSTALRYPTPYDVVEGRGVSRNADVGTERVGPATFEPELPIVSRDDKDARVLGTSFVRSNVDSK